MPSARPQNLLGVKPQARGAQSSILIEKKNEIEGATPFFLFFIKKKNEIEAPIKIKIFGA